MASEAEQTIDAGPFGQWLTQARRSLQGNGGMDVPCGDCTGCCTSGYSVQLRPEDKGALAKIPVELRVTAVGFPAGHQTMPALPDGRCPMLSDHRCTIYSERPQTCLDYDCRIFAAAGIDAGGPGKVVINRRVRAWRFSYPNEADRRAHDAVLAASKFVRERKESFVGRVPSAPMGVAVLAIKAYGVFLEAGAQARSDERIAQELTEAGRRFDELAGKD